MGNMYKNGNKKKTKYIVRFDDLCPEMDWEIWNKIIEVLYKYNVKPIIAVIPNNQDPTLKKGKYNFEFWNLIYKYQQDGFMVALHGYNHVYTNNKSGIIGISTNSEFVGLCENGQNEKILKGIEIFKNHGINVDAFVAPSHSFDKITLKVLAKHSIRVISDGHTKYPYKYKNFLWIPCQQWDNFIEEKEGIFTICIHHNNWSVENVNKFEEEIKKYISQIISPFEIENIKKISIYGKIYNIYKRNLFSFKRIIKKVLKNRRRIIR